MPISQQNFIVIPVSAVTSVTTWEVDILPSRAITYCVYSNLNSKMFILTNIQSQAFMNLFEFFSIALGQYKCVFGWKI